MRLLDQITQTTQPLVLRDNWGRVAAFDGVPKAAPELATCPVRYVLDKAATAQCRDLVLGAREMFHPEDSFLRVPSERFWVEWFSDSSDDQQGASVEGDQRMGALITADPSGRRGNCTTFWSAPGGPQTAEATLHFDLDRVLELPSNCDTRFRFSHGELDHLNPLFKHVFLEMDPQWHSFVSKWPAYEIQKKVASLATGTWWVLPIILSFSAMLNSGGLLDERRSDLQRLNASRVKAKRKPLLDHTEIGMKLGFSNVSHALGAGDTDRRSPRLHYVRGHLVRRAGMTFWRASHLRGDIVKPMGPRTIRMAGTRRSHSEQRTQLPF